MMVLELRFQLCVLTGRAERVQDVPVQAPGVRLADKMVVVLKVFRNGYFPRPQLVLNVGVILTKGASPSFQGARLTQANREWNSL